MATTLFGKPPSAPGNTLFGKPIEQKKVETKEVKGELEKDKEEKKEGRFKYEKLFTF